MNAIAWTPRALKDLKGMERQARERIIMAVARMAETEQGDIRRLRDVEPSEYRLRVGEWRVRFKRDRANTIVVLRVLPRDKAYK